MIIQYCSDLHLEFLENKKFLLANPLQVKGDILLLGGDIILFAGMDRHQDFFDFISDHFQMTYWLPGNHEYYYDDISKKPFELHEKIRDNVILINNASVDLGGVRLVFSTLWTHIRPVNAWSIEQRMSDFQVIRWEGGRFSSEHYNQLHEECLNWLSQELKKDYSGKTVVITHHVPTFLNYPEKYKGDPLNEAFAVELYDLIEASTVDKWIYGHHHCHVPSFKIRNTELITNQLGYVSRSEHQFFDRGAIVSLK